MTESLRRVRQAFEGILEIERELGQGSIAAVYIGREPDTGRRVAVKVLPPELTETVGAERFQKEISIGSGLSHPRIVPVHASGRANGFLYFSMPFIDGESLAQRLDRGGQLPLQQSIEIACQVAEALDAAHERGIIHRDIKPENIMLAEGGAAVMDFGIARLVQELRHERLTEAGLAMGTPHYMSPEQASGQERLDGRADQYGLACVLYEMLAGHPPFQGSTSQTLLTRHRNDPVPPLGSVRPDIPPSVQAVIEKALSKLPADRFGTGGEFARALEMAVGGVTPHGVMAAATSPVRSGWRWSKPRKLLTLATGGVVLLVGLRVGGPRVGRQGGLEPPTGAAQVVPRGGVEPMAVAVMPFTAAGADSTVRYLAEAMPLLLAADMNYGDPPRGPFAATESEAARREALYAGAGLVVTGSLIGGPERVTLRARLIRSRSGTPEADESVSGPLDSLRSIVTRLALQLYWSGLDPNTRRHIAEAPVAAVRAVLRNRVASRHEDVTEMVDQALAAVSADSTFGPAIVVFHEAVLSAPGLEDLRPTAESLIERYRDRLPADYRDSTSSNGTR